MSIVAFDVDGVIVHSNRSWILATNAALSNRKLPNISEEHFRVFSTSSLENWIGDVGLFIGGIDDIDTFKLEYLKCHSEIVENVKPQLYDGILATLDRLLANGHTLCIISNRPMNDYEREIAPLLAGVEFEYIRCRDNVDSYGVHNGNAKPNSDYLNVVLMHFRCTPQDIIYIGDVYEDYLFAQNTGMRFIQAQWGYDNNGLLGNVPNVLRADAPLHLLEFIQPCRGDSPTYQV